MLPLIVNYSIVSIPVYICQDNLSDLTLFIQAGECAMKQYRTYKNNMQKNYPLFYSSPVSTLNRNLAYGV